jgi:hypothetical protein
MFKIIKNATIPTLAIVIIVMLGCSITPAVSTATSSQTGKQSTSQPLTPPAAQPPVQQDTTSIPGKTTATAPATVQTPPVLQSRIDVVYSHMNQRCPTCLCFEERINTVIETYFSEQLNSGKLTYKVLNAQEAQNAAFAKKWGAVGSQLFINTVINGFDNIEDIQDIWNWDCRTNKPGFDLKVKNAIEQRLKGLS